MDAVQDRLARLAAGAYLGQACLALGEHERAELLAAEGWRELQNGAMVGEQPQGWCWELHHLLGRLGREAQARAALEAAYADLQRQAHAISDNALRRSFFERVPLNRAIVAAYDRMGQVERAVTVKLARRSAPLGRRLEPHEYTQVRWPAGGRADRRGPGAGPGGQPADDLARYAGAGAGERAPGDPQTQGVSVLE
jgi:hypothetical protein